MSTGRRNLNTRFQCKRFGAVKNASEVSWMKRRARILVNLTLRSRCNTDSLSRENLSTSRRLCFGHVVLDK